jgi:hypothetical protein
MMEAEARQQPRLRDRLEALCLEMIDRGILFSEAAGCFEKCFIMEMLSITCPAPLINWASIEIRWQKK